MNPPRHAPPPPPPSDAPPQLDRALAVMRDMKDEYDAALAENKEFLSMRHSYHLKFEAQLQELEHVERSLGELEAAHNKYKADADAEIARLKAQLAHHRPPPAPAPAARTAALPTSAATAQSDPPPSDPAAAAAAVAAASGDHTQQQPAPTASSAAAARPVPAASTAALPAVSAAAAAAVTAPAPTSATTADPNPAAARSRHHPPMTSVHSDPINPARSLPSSLPAPLSAGLTRSHAPPEPAAAAHHPQQHQPYAPPLQSAFSASRQAYQPPHARLQPPHHVAPQHSQQHPNPYSQLPHHADQMSLGHAKFPRLGGPGHTPSHQLQISQNTSGPLPSPGSLANAPAAIPSMMSSAVPNGPRHGAPHEVQPMGLVSNGPAQHQDDRLLQNKQRSRIGATRAVAAPMLANTARSPASAINPSGRPRHPTLTNAEDPTRISTTDDDWGVLPGRAGDGAVVNMNISLQHSLVHDSVVCCVRYSWDGRYLATGSNRSAHIFDANSGQRVAKFVESRSGEEDEGGGPADTYVRAVCFSPNGEWLITGAEDHVVKVWDVRNRVVKHRLCGHGTDIYSVDASANSRFIISGSGDKKAKLWSLESGELLSTLGDEYGPTDGITSVSVSPTSQHVAAGSLDKIVRVWDVETGRLVRQFQGHNDSVYSVAFSPDGTMLLSGSLDKTLKLWDLTTPQPNNQCRLSFVGHKDFVLSVAFSPNGRWLISGSKDRTVQFWDPRQSSMCLTLQGHKNSVISIAHNPSSSFLSTGSGDCRARTWLYD